MLASDAIEATAGWIRYGLLVYLASDFFCSCSTLFCLSKGFSPSSIVCYAFEYWPLCTMSINENFGGFGRSATYFFGPVLKVGFVEGFGVFAVIGPCAFLV